MEFFPLVSQWEPALGGLPCIISGCLVVLYKQPCVRLVGVVETWRRIFAKILLKVTVPKATMTFQDYQLCARLKAEIDGAVNIVQAIWDGNSTT